MLQIRLLGQFDVRAGGKRVNIPSRTAQSLFAYLALTAGTVHRREKLAGIFWPDSSEENARKNLRQELWRIRKAIAAAESDAADYFTADELTLAFNQNANYWLDIHQLEKPDFDLQSLISNLALYEGELLPGFYDDWVALERERIQTVFETRMEQLIEKLVAAGRWTAVQEQAERWLALGSAPEPAYRALMLAYGSHGNTAKVASIFQRCTDDLHDLFGVEPSAETRALYDGLLKGARAPAKPSSTVTFLFTDVEGSTRLLENLGGQYATVLAEHHEILRLAIRKSNGNEMDTQGDAFFVTFTRASDAVQCAVEAQRLLASHHWTGGLPLRVRMGLHTGEPLIASTGYVGMDVHRAARIGDAGHGGQVLLSQATRELVIHDLPRGVTIRDLGEYRLKDMKYPTCIYQLVIEGLPSEFPALRTKSTGLEPPAPGDPPFKGLQYFDQGDADLFFGREALTAKLAGQLREARSLSAVIGASGSGKSSVVRAGLIPALKRGAVLMDGTRPPEGSAGWDVHVITPSAHPLQALAMELTRGVESVTATAALMDDLARDPRSLYLFLLRRVSARDSAAAAPHTLLLIDQFEELFTLCRDEFEREAFTDNLLTAISPNASHRDGGSHVTLVITLRADFYAHLAQYPDLRDAIAQHQEYIGPMTTEELRCAIEGPAARAHWDFEPGLVDLILRDVGNEPGALPLLSHALLETWKRRAGHTLTLKGYADAGGVRGAIAHTAESTFQNLAPDDQTIARDIFLRLTELGEGTEDTRRRASFEELMPRGEDAEQVRSVLNRLAEARLITIGENTAEVAHEALIREWPALREWLNQDREGLHLHRHLTEAAHEWELLGRDPGALYRGAHLAQAREWSAMHPRDLNAAERAFLDASVGLEQQEQMQRQEQLRRELEAARKLAESERQRAEGQTRSTRQLRRRAYYLVGIVLLALILAIAAFVQRNTATRQEHIATARELALASINNLDMDPELSILLGLRAVSESSLAGIPVPAEVQDALHRAIQDSRIVYTMPLAGEANAVAYSPDGKLLATGGADKTAIVRDASTGKTLVTLKGHTQAIDDIAFSRDGKILGTAGADKMVILWDIQSGKELRTISTDEIPWSISFSAGGELVAAAGMETAKVWDVNTGELWKTLEGQRGPLAFSPVENRLATSGADGSTKVWDVDTWQEQLSLPYAANALAFSPDGTRIAAGWLDLKVWNASTGEELASATGFKAMVISIQFSSDGSRIATGSQDGAAILWDAKTGKRLFALEGHKGAINDVAFSPQCARPPQAIFEWCGVRLATAGRDGTVKVWDVSPGGSREVTTLPGATGSFRDATHLVTHIFTKPDFSAQEVQTWDVSPDGNTRWISSTDLNFETSPMGGGLSADGTRLATWSHDNTVKVWDTQKGKETSSFRIDPAKTILAIALNPNGTQVAAGNADGTVNLWEAATGRKLLSVAGNVGPEFGVVAFSPDGTRIAAGGGEDGIAQVWDAQTGQKLLTLTGHSLPLYAIAFSADEKRIATAGMDQTAKIWDAATGRNLLTLVGHTASIVALAFSPDRSLLITGGLDGTARVWDVAENPTAERELLVLTGHDGYVDTVAFSPDAKWMATGSMEDGTVRVYVLDPADLAALARARLTRTFTAEECQKYLHQPACP